MPVPGLKLMRLKYEYLELNESNKVLKKLYLLREEIDYFINNRIFFMLSIHATKLQFFACVGCMLFLKQCYQRSVNVKWFPYVRFKILVFLKYTIYFYQT